ncbi:NUDIX family hydrolase [Ceratobasidium sp. AG-Ba]|nr:NUDIX family hydrolase [Ceratobasidium sp. AG-Ba]QRW03061.1 NUDIX family hydrolase [Ceratobasidium sp. AG-Ba]
MSSRLKSAAGEHLTLKPESEMALEQLLDHKPAYPLPGRPRRFPRSRQAAVLVALFVGRLGDIYVLLSRRSMALRTYGGDTSLPGGKVEPNDRTIEDTARREAYEEVGLPIDKRRIPLLCILEPFLSGNNLIVTPVVVLIKDQSLKPKLNAPEVDLLFTHPLRAFLYEEPPIELFPLGSNPPADGAIRLTHPPHASSLPANPSHQRDEGEAKPSKPRSKQPLLFANRKRFSMEAHKAKSTPAYPPPEQPEVAPYHTYVDVAWGTAKEPVRFHRFLTGREEQGVKPIFGLTASILLHAAMVAYHPQQPDFEVRAPNQRSTEERFDTAMRTVPVLRDAARAEKLKEWGPWQDEKALPKGKL